MLRAPSALRDPTRAWTWAAVAISALAAVSPFFRSEWLPLTDYPQHLAAAAFLHHEHDPIYARYFVLDGENSQYLLVYELIHLLAYPFGLELAGRLVVALSAGLLPIALAFYLDVHGRPAILGAFAGAVAIQWTMIFGFLNFALGMSIGLFALGLAHRIARGGGGRDVLSFALLCIAAFYCHPLSYGWMALACAAQWTISARAIGLRTALEGLAASIVAAVPSVVLFFLWITRSQVLTHGEHRERSTLAAGDGRPDFEELTTTLRLFFERSTDVYIDSTGLRIALAFLVAVATLAALRGVTGGWRAVPRARPEPARGLRSWLARAPREASHTFAPEVVLLVTLAIYLFAPHSYRYVSIHERFASYVLPLLVVLGPLRLDRARALAAVGIAAIALSVGVARTHAAQFQRTDTEMGELREVLAHTEPGRRLLGVMYARHGQVIRHPSYWHAHMYYQALVGGLASLNFAELRHSPVVFREETAPPPWDGAISRRSDLVAMPGHREYFDYYLLYHEPNRRPHTMPREGGPPLLFEGERWTLYGWPDGAPPPAAPPPGEP